MKLRKWQSDCSDIAIQHFKTVSKHFLCLTTPGAGKTVMAAEVAARLIELNEIDIVLCFSPSKEVSTSIKLTFSRRLKAHFDGVIGAVGGSYTYHSISFFNGDFWDLLKFNRVLVIFDEIHHCSGSSINNANAWGEEIIENIQHQAKYTLALTGTPWRSDKLPIVLSKYCDNTNTIKCDYVYGLQQAVNDNVCRKPNLVLIDNEKLLITDEEKQTKEFSSFKDLLAESSVSYQLIITNPEIMRHILMLGCQKLQEIRQQNPAAAALAVASSVSHAIEIINILKTEFNQQAVLATYKQDKPQDIIDKFITSQSQWIVSVGMVSEGTDIPRLQVCCHLSRVKTELYYRQVLGRILRVNNEINQEAWLYTFAEPSLSEYSYRIEREIPTGSVVIKEEYPQDTTIDLNLSLVETSKLNQDNYNGIKEISIGDSLSIPELDHMYQPINKPLLNLDVVGCYREQVISTFNSPF